MSTTGASSSAKAPALPRSAAPFGLSLAGLAGGLAAIWIVAAWNTGIDRSNTLAVTLIACAVVAAIIGAGDLFWLRSYRQASTGLAPAALRKADPLRIAVRLLGLALTIGLMLFVYWLFPEYGAWYDTYWLFLRDLAWVVVPLAPLYFWWTDTRLVNPQDAYWQLGMLALRGRFGSADWALLKAHFMGWTVKAFFLALMVVFLNNDVRVIVSNLSGTFGWAQLRQYDFLFTLSYTVDLLFCVVGYAMTLRLFDSHIRSTEPTAFGWVIALMCYNPFWDAVIGRFYLHYDDEIFWDNWLGDWPNLRSVWPAAIILLLFIYSLSTVAFGLRFSNLTYRGIITNGPYRFSKHPAYISKNLSWWLISVPWISHHGWTEAVRNCCLLGLNNLIYYFRARTEERHLSQDPAYVAYALWIEEHGVLRWLGRLLPFLRYHPPTESQTPASAPPAAAARGAQA
jgi:isoprenylcysteine carboxyl methyltransferase (ICMT) family protein YpbQ